MCLNRALLVCNQKFKDPAREAQNARNAKVEKTSLWPIEFPHDPSKFSAKKNCQANSRATVFFEFKALFPCTLLATDQI